MEIGWLMFGFFVFVTMIFVVIALFLPEWVGITGKKAKEIMKEQAGDHHSTGSTNSSDDIEAKKK